MAPFMPNAMSWHISALRQIVGQIDLRRRGGENNLTMQRLFSFESELFEKVLQNFRFLKHSLRTISEGSQIIFSRLEHSAQLNFSGPWEV